MLHITPSVKVGPLSLEDIYLIYIQSDAFKKILKAQLDKLPRAAHNEFVIFFVDDQKLLSMNAVTININGSNIKVETRSSEIHHQAPWTISVGYGVGNLE